MRCFRARLLVDMLLRGLQVFLEAWGLPKQTSKKFGSEASKKLPLQPPKLPRSPSMKFLLRLLSRRKFSEYIFLRVCLGNLALKKIRDKKSMAMAMFKRKFARTILDNLRAPHIKMWGFEARRARKFTRTSPRTLPFFFHYHAFFFPEKILWRGFLVNFSGLRFPRNEARKTLKNFRESFGAKFGARS